MIAVDTNVFGYAEGGVDTRKCKVAMDWLLRLNGDVVMPTQVAGELYNVLTRKFRWNRALATERVDRWRNATVFVAPSASDFDDALRLATEHNLQIWDALILVVSATAGCRALLSEDMQNGFVYRGVTVANPFAERIHPLLASLMDSLTPSRPAGAPE